MLHDFNKDVEEFLELTAKEGASDIHFSVGRHPTLRIDGVLLPLTKYEIVTPQYSEGIAFALLEDKKDVLLQDKEIDFSYSYKQKARFRVNIFYERSFISSALRLIPSKIRTLEELNLPKVIHKFADFKQGFFLVVGPTGHGKSTTLAALIDEINHQRTEHIVTIEDPIEYIFMQDRSIIDQREVGFDTKSFDRALKSVFRQDVNVVMIGEMRDPETIATAVTAAETGHLVFSTLHTNNASQTIDRIIDTFPASQQNQIRSQLAATLAGVVSQRLIPRIEGGRMPAVEIMFGDSAIRNLIREKKTHQINSIISTSFDEGMMSLNNSLANLVRAREISLENAEYFSTDPAELRILLHSEKPKT